MKFWDAEQLGRFLRSVQGTRLEAAWYLAAMTGMRRGEVLGLRWQDVDLNAARLAVRHTLVSSSTSSRSRRRSPTRRARSTSISAPWSSCGATAIARRSSRRLEVRATSRAAWCAGACGPPCREAAGRALRSGRSRPGRALWPGSEGEDLAQHQQGLGDVGLGEPVTAGTVRRAKPGEGADGGVDATLPSRKAPRSRPARQRPHGRHAHAAQRRRLLQAHLLSQFGWVFAAPAPPGAVEPFEPLLPVLPTRCSSHSCTM
jgi:hypothetical protein